MRESSTPKVNIILLNWNGWQDTLECLDSLDDLEYPNYEVIVVDNASSDNSIDKIKERYPAIILLESKSNLGFAGGNNIGIRYAMKHGADYVWILNNDTVVDEHALTNLVKKMEDDPELGICGSKLIYYHHPKMVQALAGGSYNKYLGVTKNFGHQKSIDLEFEVQEVEDSLEFIVGASMMVSRTFLEEVGLMSEDYFLYYEEIDWAMRAKTKFKLGFAPNSIIYHKEGASIEASNLDLNNKSKLSDYYQIKNRLKFTYKFFPYCLPTIYLTVIYAILNRIKRKQWDRIPMIIKLMFTFNK